MTLTIDRQLMDAIYAARPKLFVSSADAAHFSRGLDGAALEASGIALIHYEAAGKNGDARLQSPGSNAGEFVTLATPPTGHCLLAAATPQGRDQLSALLTWWRENGANGTPELLELDALSSSDPATWQVKLFQRLAEIAQVDARRSAEREVMACGQLYELRQEYEQARAVMQDQLARLNQTPCRLDYCYPPSVEKYHPASEGEIVHQLLPVRADGLAGIDLFIPHATRSFGPDEHFIVTLMANETAGPLGTWMIHGHHLGRGWTRCAFPTALNSPFRQLELLVQWCGATRHCPGLGLSPIQPWTELCAHVNGKPLPGALAHAVWSAVPGVRTGFSSAPLRAESAASDNSTFVYVVSNHALACIVPTTPTAAHYLDILPDRVGFRLHPLDGIIAAAVVPEACLPGAQSATAVVQISHAAAKYPVEYAIAMTRSFAKHRAFPTDARAPDVVAISNWQPVPADGAPHVVGLTLPKPHDEALDLHVATRMTDGHPTAYQWADWLELRVTLRGSTPIMPVEK